MREKYNNSVLLVAHYLWERQADDEAYECGEFVIDVEEKEKEIEKICEGLQYLHDHNETAWDAIYSEYFRHHPYYDGNWWEEGHHWSTTKEEWEEAIS